MVRALIYKEALATRTYFVIGLMYGLLEFLSHLLRRHLVGGPTIILNSGIDGGLVLSGLILFAVGHGQVAPEVRRGHIELLDGLPIRRVQVFAAKIFLGIALGALLLLARLMADQGFASLAFGETSLVTMGPVMAGHSAGLLAFYASGLLFSWFGGFGWVLLGVGMMAVFTAAEMSEGLRPLSLLHGYASVRFEANDPVIHRWPTVFWALYGLGVGSSSGLLFLGPGDGWVRRGSAVGPRLRRLVLGAIAALLGLAAILAVVPGQDGPSKEAKRVDVGRFRLLVPRVEDELLSGFLSRLAMIDRKLAQLFGVEMRDAPLDVELLGGGRYHAGVYTGGKIRMALTGDIEHTFAHELAHAYAHQLATDASLRRHMDALRFFNEGLAMWAAERVVPDSTRSTDRFREWAAATRHGNHHYLDLLMQDSQRQTYWDGFEAYPLGLVFVEALIDLGGPEIIPCLLREVARLPQRTLLGVEIWGHLSRACDIAWPKVVEAYDARLDRYTERWPGPDTRLTGAVRRVGGTDYVFLGPAAEGVVRHCRFRSRSSAGPSDMSDVAVDDQGRCRVRMEDTSSNTVWFQVGVELTLGWVSFGPWFAQPIPGDG